MAHGTFSPEQVANDYPVDGWQLLKKMAGSCHVAPVLPTH